MGELPWGPVGRGRRAEPRFQRLDHPPLDRRRFKQPAIEQHNVGPSRIDGGVASRAALVFGIAAGMAMSNQEGG